MATQSFNSSPNWSSNAAIRAGGAQISAALAACGLVKATDTGQVDWTTTASTGTASSSVGYEIWRFNDALQASKPVFLKITYSFGSSAGAIGVIITVGTGSDGAGNLTGVVLNTAAMGTVSGTLVSAVLPTYVSGDGSYLTLALWLTNTTAGRFYCIDRTRNADGTANGDGLYLLTCADSSTPAWQVVPFTGAPAPGATNCPPCPFPPAATATNPFTGGTQGTDISLYPHVICTPKVQAPALAVMGCWRTDFSQFVPISVPTHGGVHTFLPLGPSVTQGSAGQSPSVGGTPQGVANASLAMRYE